ncbi:MAG: hypothetical protein NZM11_10745, partial [Anaerolineales bacterium]|nr:hypothetical protein [Anaerolineales bacterium]
MPKTPHRIPRIGAKGNPNRIHLSFLSIRAYSCFPIRAHSCSPFVLIRIHSCSPETGTSTNNDESARTAPRRLYNQREGERNVDLSNLDYFTVVIVLIALAVVWGILQR